MDKLSSFDISELPLITQIRLTSFTGDSGGRIRVNTSGVTPQQQKGPTCGLLALSICLEHFGVNISVEQIMEKAKEKSFTKQGEMYSEKFETDMKWLSVIADSISQENDLRGAYYLASLCNEFLPNSSSVHEFPDAKKFSKAICDGKLLLIAYDCGPNYQAVHAKGNSAHWLLACGFVEKHDNVGFVEANKPVDESEIAIVGYQGKSTALNIFPFSEVAASNSQLLEAGTKRDPLDYIIPNPLDLCEIRNLVVEVALSGQNKNNCN